MKYNKMYMKRENGMLIAISIIILLGFVVYQKFVKVTQNSTIDHIIIVVMENKSYSDIVGNADAPYINSLIKKYSFADNYFAVSHPSLPNYIALIGGNTFGISSDCLNCYIKASNLIDQLESAGKTWKAYMESMPSACFVGNAGKYVQKHNPFIYFDNIRTDPKRCMNIVPYSQFLTDIGSTKTTPNFIFITPNECNDMHDCSTQIGDAWLANNVQSILNSPSFIKQKSLLVITWDEGEGSGDNLVPTVFVGNAAKEGFVSHARYTHYSLLKTIEDVWNLQPLTINASQSNNMLGMLQMSNSNH